MHNENHQFLLRRCRSRSSSKCTFTPHINIYLQLQEVNSRYLNTACVLSLYVKRTVSFNVDMFTLDVDTNNWPDFTAAKAKFPCL